MKTVVGLALAAGLATTTSGQATPTYHIKVYAPKHPQLHLQNVNAASGAFYLGANTSTYCPPVVSNACPPTDRGTVVYSAMKGMAVIVPGGQSTYVSPDGALHFTQAHSAYMPPGSFPSSSLEHYNRTYPGSKQVQLLRSQFSNATTTTTREISSRRRVMLSRRRKSGKKEDTKVKPKGRPKNKHEDENDSDDDSDDDNDDDDDGNGNDEQDNAKSGVYLCTDLPYWMASRNATHILRLAYPPTFNGNPSTANATCFEVDGLLEVPTNFTVGAWQYA